MHKILIIDDEESLVKNIGDFLSAKGYDVSTSLNGTTGLELFKSRDPDLLVLDLHLKDGPSGKEVLKTVKMLKRDLKVVILTGFGDDDNAKSDCISLGADAFLSKPTSLKKLTETIENILGKNKK